MKHTITFFITAPHYWQEKGWQTLEGLITLKMQLDRHATLERGLQKLERCLSTKRGLPVKKMFTNSTRSFTALKRYRKSLTALKYTYNRMSFTTSERSLQV